MTKKTTTKKKRSPGRRTVLNDEIIDRICERIRGVFYLKHCIESLGHSERILYVWLQRGQEEIARMEKTGATRPRRGEEIFVKLERSVRRAQSDLTQALSRVIIMSATGQKVKYAVDKKGDYVLDKAGNLIVQQDATPPNWQAAARFLEAVDHERWGRKIRAEVTGPEGGPTELIITVVKKRELKPPPLPT